MGEPTIFWKIRLWLAFSIALPLFYFLFGQKPLFCDLVGDGCNLDEAVAELAENRQMYHGAMWALIMGAGGEIRVSQFILDDARHMGEIETHVDVKTGDYVYSAKP